MQVPCTKTSRKHNQYCCVFIPKISRAIHVHGTTSQSNQHSKLFGCPNSVTALPTGPLRFERKSGFSPSCGLHSRPAFQATSFCIAVPWRLPGRWCGRWRCWGYDLAIAFWSKETGCKVTGCGFSRRLVEHPKDAEGQL